MLADWNWVYVVLLRWLHIAAACLLVGSIFLVAMILPRGTSIEPSPQGSRRRIKMLVHTCILLLLVSGICNAIGNWTAYRRNMPWTHALFGPHLVLGLCIFVILLVLLAARQPRQREAGWLRLTAVLLLLTVLVASGLKYAREHPKAQFASPAITQNR